MPHTHHPRLPRRKAPQIVGSEILRHVTIKRSANSAFPRVSRPTTLQPSGTSFEAPRPRHTSTDPAFARFLHCFHWGPCLPQSETGATASMADRGHRGGGRGGPRGGRGGGGRGGAAAGAAGADSNKERPKKENILDLKRYMDKRITVKFNGGREGVLSPLNGHLRRYGSVKSLG
jgi:hypothetical protein